MDFIYNIPFLAGVLGWFVAEILKMLVKGIRYNDWKSISWKDLFSSGGMPSSHSAAVCALTTAIFLTDGPLSSTFAIGAVLSAIVMYDASGVRHETGKQGKTLNMIIVDLFSSDPRYSDKAFKELVGHTKMQVLIGALVGIGIGVACYFGFGYLFAHL